MSLLKKSYIKLNHSIPLLLNIVGFNYYLQRQKRQHFQSFNRLRHLLSLRSVRLTNGHKINDEWFRAFVAIRPAPRTTRADTYPEGESKILSSGFIADDEGLVVTAASGVMKYSQVSVEMSDKSRRIGRVVDINGDKNMAIIKLEERAEKWPVVTYATGSTINVGDPVMSVVTPRYGMQYLAEGLISSERRYGSELTDTYLRPVDRNYAYIQHTAYVSVNCLGAALVTPKGHVIGINCLHHQLNINFCIHYRDVLNYVKAIKNKLKDETKEPKKSFGLIMYWFGAIGPEEEKRLQAMDSEVKVVVISDVCGALIWNFSKNSSAEKKGMERFDVITHINGVRVTSMDDIYRSMATKDKLVVRINNEEEDIALEKTVDDYIFV